MSAIDVVERELSYMSRNFGESFEDFAKRLYYRQMEIYSGLSGRDIAVPFENLPADTRIGWIEQAKQHSHT